MAIQKRKISAEEKEACRFQTPIFRVSYPHVFKPHQMPNSKSGPKYSITMLVPKDTDMASYKAAVKQAKLNFFGSKENWPEEMEAWFQDGDSKKNKAKEGYPGHWVIKATSNEDQKPGVVDKTGTKIITETSQFYPGCYARAKIFAYGWEFSGKYGVSFILDHVQFVRDGEAFGGRESAIGAFAPIEADDSANMSEDEDDDDMNTSF